MPAIMPFSNHLMALLPGKEKLLQKILAVDYTTAKTGPDVGSQACVVPFNNPGNNEILDKALG